MRISNIELKENVLTINVNDVTSAKVWVDAIGNQKNIYSEDDKLHTITVNDVETENGIANIIISDLKEKAYIVTLVSDEQINTLVYDKEYLYNSTVDLFSTYCDTCLDKHQKEKIVMCDLFNHLLKYSIENNLIEDSIQHYIQLCKILDLSAYNTGESKCRVCINNCCRL